MAYNKCLVPHLTSNSQYFPQVTRFLKIFLNTAIHGICLNITSPSSSSWCLFSDGHQGACFADIARSQLSSSGKEKNPELELIFLHHLQEGAPEAYYFRGFIPSGKPIYNHGLGL